jgi:MerR family transcriptional regulator, thiopeptide resistance regulator
VRREIAETRAFKVGELAGRTGLSVRTLHHYDEIGLLSPSRRTEAGHRIYSAHDVVRLQQIRSLRSLGFGLEKIRALLAAPGLSVGRTLELHMAGLRDQIRARQEFLQRLEAVAQRLRSAEEASAEELVDTAMEVIEMSERIEKYYTPEQLEYLEGRRREFGDERIREFEAQWEILIEAVKTEMQAETDPFDERVQKLARRWMELVEAFTGGDPGIARSLGQMWQQEENIHGIDTAEMRELGAYISRAQAAWDDRA